MKSDDPLAEKLSGKFIVLDGPDGCGKTTQLAMLAERFASDGLRVVEARDPGGTQIGDRIRRILLDYDLSKMDLRCETFLFMASRAQLVAEIIEPAIADGAVVLCSRFISATYAYQGAAGYDVTRMLELGNWAVENTWPDLTIILDVPVEVGFERTGRKPHHAGANRKKLEGDQGQLFMDATVDAMEARSTEYHHRVRDTFLSLPTVYPKPVRIIDGGGTLEQVQARVLELIEGVDF